ncbi:hypothetical protein B0J11DRAFT_540001 [Dendryphion nanum]|uniref:Uncharacterized protein n=1 Tax=Dendryphion nanum TaxID=256645 RepID=A0A9P9D9Z2_9PLEO|nr:hypothetical protein B0J11DRAFT_540001 [Dendryphion nanum]
MSSSIAIPRRKKRHGENNSTATPSCTGPSPSSSSSSSSFGYNSFPGNRVGSTNSTSSPAASQSPSYRDRRPSLMSQAFTQAEHTVINIGNSEYPRLISCVKASQGFHWNQEIFLPSYAEYHHEDIERKQDPVQDIFVTDEEVANLFPS